MNGVWCETTFAALEREVLGAPAHEAVSAPKLLRAVSAAGDVLSDPAIQKAVPLPDVRDQDPEGNWVKGRILLPSGLEPMNETSAVLSGSLEPLKGKNDETSMDWALARPWVFLTGQFGFHAGGLAGGAHFRRPGPGTGPRPV